METEWNENKRFIVEKLYHESFTKERTVSDEHEGMWFSIILRAVSFDRNYAENLQKVFRDIKDWIGKECDWWIQYMESLGGWEITIVIL